MAETRRTLATIIVDAGHPLPASAPSELTDAQAAVWHDVVGSLPGRWLTPGAFPVLIAYCRHVIRTAKYVPTVSELRKVLLAHARWWQVRLEIEQADVEHLQA